MPQIRHKGTVFAGSPYDPLKHYVEEEDYETDKAYTEADIANILGDIANSEESPALKSHGIGELILFEKKLYKVSAAIAIGDTLVDGTNIEETDVASEIAALQVEDTSIKESLTMTNSTVSTLSGSITTLSNNKADKTTVDALPNATNVNTNRTGCYVRVKPNLKIAEFICSIDGTVSGVGTGWWTLCTIPAGYRPSVLTPFVYGQGGDGSVSNVGRILTDGQVSIYLSSASLNTPRFSVMYFY